MTFHLITNDRRFRKSTIHLGKDAHDMYHWGIKESWLIKEEGEIKGGEEESEKGGEERRRRGWERGTVWGGGGGQGMSMWLDSGD